jgi:quercetin dioxygenase-like cupin family protein
VRINGKKFKQGDVIVIRPNEAADYEALSDAITVIVKTPAVKNDKYFVKRSK